VGHKTLTQSILCIFVCYHSAGVDKKSQITDVCSKFHRSIPDCCEQAEKTEHERVERLLDILSRRDDRLLPVFYDVLEKTDQKYIADILRENVKHKQRHGAHTFYDHHLLALSFFFVLINVIILQIPATSDLERHNTEEAVGQKLIFDH